jgi:hypothetical protein
MKRTLNATLRFAAIALLILACSCESTDSGGGSVSGSVYYGTGLYDPWYYGNYYDDPDIIVTPPSRPVAPEHPIARPPPASVPRPTPMPSIPAMPRPAMRR